MMLDLTNLKSLFGNDMTVVRRFLQTISEQLPEHLVALKDAISQQDGEQVNIMSHNIKSHLRYLGNAATADLAYEIEKGSDIAAPDWNTIQLINSQLVAGIARVLVDIKEILNTQA